MYHLLSLFHKHGRSLSDILKILLGTMYENEFVQLLEPFLLNTIMKQQKSHIAPKIFTSLFLG